MTSGGLVRRRYGGGRKRGADDRGEAGGDDGRGSPERYSTRRGRCTASRHRCVRKGGGLPVARSMRQGLGKRRRPAEKILQGPGILSLTQAEARGSPFYTTQEDAGTTRGSRSSHSQISRYPCRSPRYCSSSLSSIEPSTEQAPPSKKGPRAPRCGPGHCPAWRLPRRVGERKRAPARPRNDASMCRVFHTSPTRRRPRACRSTATTARRRPAPVRTPPGHKRAPTWG